MSRPHESALVVVAGLAAVLVLAGPVRAATVHTTDIIPDGTRTHFTGFEGITTELYSGPWEDDGIRVEQVPAGDIWTLYGPWGQEGTRSWLPNGGDNGYTRITLVDGSDFVDVGFLRGSGTPNNTYVYYRLYDDGGFVEGGTVPPPHDIARYLGFSGGGFDEIRVRDGSDPSGWTPGTFNALAIDSIETAGAAVIIPEPLTMLGIAAGIAGLGGYIRRRRRA